MAIILPTLNNYFLLSVHVKVRRIVFNSSFRKENLPDSVKGRTPFARVTSTMFAVGNAKKTRGSWKPLDADLFERS